MLKYHKQLTNLIIEHLSYRNIYVFGTACSEGSAPKDALISHTNDILGAVTVSCQIWNV